MVWVNEPETIKVERQAIDIKLIERPTKSKTFRGYLSGMLVKAKNDKNYELEVLLTEILNVFNEFAPNKLIKIEIIDGWKGKDKIEVYKGFDDDFRIKEHIKDKETGEVNEHIVEVKKEDLNRMIGLIKGLNFNEPVKCYDIAEKLGYSSWKELWKERQEYFRRYYHPLKCLEAIGLIKYGGRGIITKIK